MGGEEAKTAAAVVAVVEATVADGTIGVVMAGAATGVEAAAAAPATSPIVNAPSCRPTPDGDTTAAFTAASSPMVNAPVFARSEGVVVVVVVVVIVHAAAAPASFSTVRLAWHSFLCPAFHALAWHFFEQYRCALQPAHRFRLTDGPCGTPHWLQANSRPSSPPMAAYR